MSLDTRKFFQDLTPAKRKAVAEASAHLTDAGLPSYEDLAHALLSLTDGQRMHDLESQFGLDRAHVALVANTVQRAAQGWTPNA